MIFSVQREGRLIANADKSRTNLVPIYDVHMLKYINNLPLLFVSRMELFQGLAQVAPVQVRIYLGCGNALVSHHFLHRS